VTAVAPKDRLLPSRVRAHLSTRAFGQRLYYYPEIGSTNDAARALAVAGEAEGTVVYSDHQRGGRGRGTRRWLSPPGRDLLFSVVLRPPGEPRSALPVTLVVAAAAATALSRHTGADVGVKWPNDVWCGGRKLAGILAEAAARPERTAWAVLGMGVNVNASAGELDPSLRATATTCRIVRGALLDRARLFADLLSEIEDAYERFRADGFAALAASYAARHVLSGRSVRYTRDGAPRVAQVLGVAGDGALEVRERGSGEEHRLYNEGIEVIA